MGLCNAQIEDPVIWITPLVVASKKEIKQGVTRNRNSPSNHSKNEMNAWQSKESDKEGFQNQKQRWPD